MDLPVPFLIGILAVAWFGHAFSWTMALNWCYGHGWPRRYLKLIRNVIAVCVFAFPVVAAVLLWPYGAINHVTLEAYVALCCTVSLLYLPTVSVVRACRKTPEAVVADEHFAVDFAVRLGDRPVGDGKNWRMACLPGNQIFEVEFRTLTLSLPRLPAAWDGLSILHVTDLHLCGTPGRPFYQEVFDEAMRPGPPDILALTGDIIDSRHHHRWILPLVGRLQWKTAAFAVLGNHDSYFEPLLVRRRLTRLGVQVLGNSWTSLDVRGEPLVVAGNESPWFGPVPNLKGAPDSPFRLCLSHTPDQFAWAQANGIDLMLAGHVHGGQIRLPGIGPLFVPSRFFRRYDQGQFAKAGTVMSVSRGLSGGEPLRYNCRPEITRIVLKTN